MELKKIKKVYMIGIKGVGMTMLAQYFAGNGIAVSGSDVKEKFMTDESLRLSDIKVVEDFNEDSIPADADLIVYSTAYSAKRNTEVAKALSGKTKTVSFPEALGSIFNSKYGIAVTGSHGKTTTTAMLGYVLEKAGLRPTAMVGSYVPQFSGNALIGDSDYMVAEVDEYQNKFQYFDPKAVLLNNIDYDHPDFFPTRESYENVFIELIKKIPKKGYLAANYDDPVLRKIVKVNTQCKVVTYAIDNLANYLAYDITDRADGQTFKVKLNYATGQDDGEKSSESALWAPLGEFKIKLTGRHNVYNALAVIAAGIELDIDLVDIRTYLEEFEGTARRMQELGYFNGAIIIDDYAHHPTEIRTTLDGALTRYRNKYQKIGRVLAVFHPHTFTRTKALLDDFAKSFELADEVIVLDIYGSAREEQGGVHSRDLIRKIKEWNIQRGDSSQVITYIPTLEECTRYLRSNLKRNDLVMLMGAGDVFRIGEELTRQ